MRSGERLIPLICRARRCARVGVRPRVCRSCVAVRSASAESESESSCRKSGFAGPISARRAIAIAEPGAGAGVVDLGFDGSTSHPAYRVKVLLNGELWDGAIDASTGVAVSTGPTTPVSRLREENRTILAAFSAAGIDLSEMIAIAEQYGSGKAVSAGLQHDGAKLVLVVVVVCEGSLKEISSSRRKAEAGAQVVCPRQGNGTTFVRWIVAGGVRLIE